MEQGDRFANAVLRDELRRLNSHLPKNRRILEELVADPSPTVASVSGHAIRMRKHELEDLFSQLPEATRRRIRLPLVLLRRMDLGTGSFTVLGDPYEEYAVSLLAEAFDGTFEDFRKTHCQVVLYESTVEVHFVGGDRGMARNGLTEALSFLRFILLFMHVATQILTDLKYSTC